MDKQKQILEQFYAENPQLRPENYSKQLQQDLTSPAARKVAKEVRPQQKHQHTEEEKRKLREYWATVPDSKQPAIRTEYSRKTSISYETAKQVVWQIYCKALHTKKFSGDGNTLRTLRKLTHYFSGHPFENLDLSKGLFIFGEVGTGKTTLLEVFKRYLEVEQRSSYNIKNMKILSKEVKQAGSGAIDAYLQGVWAFDDLGAENTAKHYGDEIEAFAEIINQHYIKWEKTKKPMYISTNLIPKEIAQRYGERTASRCAQIFNFVLLEGKDKRTC